MSKPTVLCELLELVAVPGQPVGTYVAIVNRTSAHPRLGPADIRGQRNRTSKVLRICFECGYIETLNTFYQFK